jgi:tetratricopeptide (TPR) repeat protein
MTDTNPRRAAAIARAEAATALRRYREAAAAAAEAIAADPQSAECHAQLASALLGDGKNEEGLRVIATALSLDGSYVWAHRLKASLLANLKRYPEALAAADEAMRISPDGLSHYSRARMLNYLGRIEEARRDVDAAIALNPNMALYHQLLGYLWHDQDPARAETLYRRALELEPQDAPTLSRDAAMAARAAVLIDPNMKSSRINTRIAMGRVLKIPLLLGEAVLLLGSLAVLAIVPAWSLWNRPLLLLLVCQAAATLWFSGMALLAIRWRQRRARLASLDPQLFEIYRKLEADRRKGRI